MSTWLVTGANRGIGLELCRQLAARGDEVIGTARSPASAGALRELGVRVVELDVRSAESAAALAGSIGDGPIDVLVNSAAQGGVGPGIDELDWEVVDQFLSTNALGPMRVTQALLPALRRGRARKVAHLSTNLASIADNTSGGYYAYRASKAALNMLHRTLAVELGREGFTCLALHPGWVQTDMGGPGAPTPPAESVAGLLAVIDGAGPGENGRFLTYRGAPLPW